MTEIEKHANQPLTLGRLVPWVIAAMSVGTAIYSFSSASTTLQMEVADHERRITKIESTIDDQQSLLYRINDQLATLNQRLIDRWGPSGPASRAARSP
ncbi:hypothetical protein FE249_00710 [Acidiphilium multivorum]|uniref:hypothetical protein n=1 Tax=Acidiphilium multivorum TaxID=62140 RepID=UPI001F4C0617|nr:hypothetical protein [Acidiphilium multivorum]UNC12851.1 hypothetical protein FE249_00710 [Acidiphilium multivorum]